MELVNLKDLLQHEIEDLYSAEEQIIEALPKMVEKAFSPQLKKVLNEHLKVPKEQKTRLDKVRELLKRLADKKEEKGFLERIFGGGTKCKGTEGLIREGEKMMAENMDAKVRDAAIIASAQKIEHYEISGYGTAKAYAVELDLPEVAKLLDKTLQEEYMSDDMLTSLALSKVNIDAEKGANKQPASGAKNGSQVPNSKTSKTIKEVKKTAPGKSSKKAGQTINRKSAVNKKRTTAK